MLETSVRGFRCWSASEQLLEVLCVRYRFDDAINQFRTINELLERRRVDAVAVRLGELFFRSGLFGPDLPRPADDREVVDAKLVGDARFYSTRSGLRQHFIAMHRFAVLFCDDHAALLTEQRLQLFFAEMALSVCFGPGVTARSGPTF